MEIAVLLNTAPGSVREGMYDMLATISRQGVVSKQNGTVVKVFEAEGDYRFVVDAFAAADDVEKLRACQVIR